DTGRCPRADGGLHAAVAAHVGTDDLVAVLCCTAHAVTEVATLQYYVAARGGGHRDGYERWHHVVSNSHGRRTCAQRECNESEDQPGETLLSVILSAETKFCTGLTSMYCFIAP